MKVRKLLSAIIAGAMVLGTMSFPVFAAPELTDQEAVDTVGVMLLSYEDSWIDSAVTDWYNATETEFTLSTAKQLAGLASLVNNGTSFQGKTIKLSSDIDLNGKNWTPIGKSGKTFQGIFDGQGNVIKNITIPGNNSDVGLFGVTTDGEIKNFTLENASVQGYLDVGAVAGTPYTSKYTNITVKGLIQVDGYAYVGGAFGKNGYADITNVDVIGNEGSYVKADSDVYRTYVGGLIGFMGEGNTTISDCNVKIDVTGSTCDVGGITGILHYGNKMVNCTYEGSLAMTNAIYSENAGEIGGLAGTFQTYPGQVTLIENSSAEVSSAVVSDGVESTDITDTVTAVGTVYSEDNKTNGEFNVQATVNERTETFSNIAAKIGDTKYTTLAAALAAASEGDTIYVYPVADGHDAFTIDKPLTIEGVPDENGNNPVVTINETTYGGVKYDAAVTLKNLDFIVDENATGSTWCQSAVGYYYENAQNRNNSSFINCNFVNNSSLNLMAIFACYSTLTVKDCTFTNFDTAIATMLDGGTLDNVAVTGNTFNAVDTLYTGYWGSSSASSNIEITNNAVNSPKSDDAVPQIIIWDYSFELGNGLGVANIDINNTYNTPTEFVANSISNQSNIVKDANITMVKSFRNADVAAAAGTLAEGEKFYLNYGSPTLEKLVTYSTQGVNLDEANTITIKLDETDEDGVYDIKLNGNGIDIYEFVGAEFTFENTSETVGGSYMAYEVSGISGQTEVTKDLTIPDKYAISLAAGADRISGAEITIGQVKFIGQGTINFSVIDGTVVTTKYNTHLERYYSVADNNLEYGTGITDGSVEADVRNIVVNVNYAHALVGSWTDNQMTVALKNAFGETSAPQDISDGLAEFTDVPVGRITVTLKAPGFRTFTYTTTVEEGTDPLVLSFWNDTKRDTTAEVEPGKAMANNFVVGDIAMDYIVDKYDLAAVTSYYGTYNLTDENKIKYDLNRDGNIDITDVAYVLHNFGF